MSINKEIILSAILLILLVLLLNPFMFWMPDVIIMSMITALVILFAIFTAFLWREKPLDERESIQAMFVGRVAFFIGTATTLIAIVIQSLNHDLDPWLLIILGSMILSKLISSIYFNRNN